MRAIKDGMIAELTESGLRTGAGNGIGGGDRYHFP